MSSTDLVLPSIPSEPISPVEVPSVSSEVVPYVPSGTPESPINAVAIRESSIGQYLESISSAGTWFQTVQEKLGFEPKPITALDVLYTSMGVAGTAMLIPIAAATGPVSIPLIAVGSTLIGISAIGLSEEDRRTKIGSGIVAGSLVIWKPSVAGFVVKEAYSATKETAKQTVELAKSSIGLTTAALGTITAVIGATAIISKKRNGPKDHRTRKRKRSSTNYK